jgi:hypothetical protein
MTVFVTHILPLHIIIMLLARKQILHQPFEKRYGIKIKYANRPKNHIKFISFAPYIYFTNQTE